MKFIFVCSWPHKANAIESIFIWVACCNARHIVSDVCAFVYTHTHTQCLARHTRTRIYEWTHTCTHTQPRRDTHSHIVHTTNKATCFCFQFNVWLSRKACQNLSGGCSLAMHTDTFWAKCLGICHVDTQRCQNIAIWQPLAFVVCLQAQLQLC